MKSLVFKEVSILSKVEKAAIKVSFDPRLNLLTGENDVGKSTLIKSLYHALGADIPRLQNTRWKKAKPIYCLTFTIGGAEYTVVRDEKYFGVFDAAKTLIGRFTGIGGEAGIAQFINSRLGFRVELEKKEDSQLGAAGPAFYFLPFYVDQDEGWTSSWASFLGLAQFKTYRKNMIEYHLGVRPQSYYDALKIELGLKAQLAEKERERNTLTAVRESYHKRKSARQVDLDPSAFKDDIEELVDRYNAVHSELQTVVHELKEARSSRHGLDNEIAILKRAIRELDADYSLAESPDTSDPIDCPTCGSEIANSITERFGILDDIDYCNGLIDQRTKKRMDVQREIEDIEARYEQINNDLSGVDELLQRNRQNVTFAELVSSEGIKELLISISEDIKDLVAEETVINESITRLAPDLKLDAKNKKSIVETYQKRMKEFLDLLNVHVLELSDYKKLDQQIKSNASGSDLPRSLLAQYMAFLHTMKAHNEFVLCPMVMDSPLQQEQDDTNVDAIFNFIFSKILPTQQLILATLSSDPMPSGDLPDGLVPRTLTTKYGLLDKAQYASVSASVGPLHEITLASDDG
ncbi:MAG: energy-coupling factor transporter ATP-binding protein EcfA2 [Hyphomicrobiaceae bacterium]|jgi:energy-coupling factor transporter ATP-binding protein EcfA2